MKFSTDEEIKGTAIKGCNYLQVLNVPSGVDIYISEIPNSRIKDAYKYGIGDTLEVLKGMNLGSRKELYLFTIGTATDDYVEIETKALNSSDDWIRKTEKATVVSFDEQAKVLFDNQTKSLASLRRSIDPLLCGTITLVANTDYTLDTTNIKYLRLASQSEKEFNMFIGGVPMAMLIDDVDTQLLDSVTFNSTIGDTLNYWGA